jgi:hypothetical protein
MWFSSKKTHMPSFKAATLDNKSGKAALSRRAVEV